MAQLRLQLSRHSTADSHLGRGFVDFVRHLCNHGMLDQMAAAQAPIGHHCNTPLLAHIPQLLVLELGVHLNLTMHARLRPETQCARSPAFGMLPPAEQVTGQCMQLRLRAQACGSLNAKKHCGGHAMCTQ